MSHLAGKQSRYALGNFEDVVDGVSMIAREKQSPRKARKHPI
jgi:hypothetical protein